MVELVSAIARSLVEHPDAVEVTETKSDDTTVIQLKVAEDDMGMVIGKQGSMLKQIATMARTDLEEMFGTKVNLQCWVKVKEDWRNRQGFLSGLGYRID